MGNAGENWEFSTILILKEHYLLVIKTELRSLTATTDSTWGQPQPRYTSYQGVLRWMILNRYCQLRPHDHPNKLLPPWRRPEETGHRYHMVHKRTEYCPLWHRLHLNHSHRGCGASPGLLSSRCSALFLYHPLLYTGRHRHQRPHTRVLHFYWTDWLTGSRSLPLSRGAPQQPCSRSSPPWTWTMGW